MIREIIRMKHAGLSNNQISQNLGRSRTTIIKYVRDIESSGFSLEELLSLQGPELYELFEIGPGMPVRNQEGIHKELYDYFPDAGKELKRVGVTRYLLWQEYQQKHPDGVMYTQFCEHFKRWLGLSEGYMPIEHKAGDKLFIDYAGKKLSIVDRDTGEITPVDVFVATLGCSQYTYVEASYSQKLPDFINSVQNALYYFGGVPGAIVPDNLKSAVTKTDKYAPFINEQFACFASHYDTTILPARSRKPKDKSLVEGAVNIAYSRIYARLRNTVFHSLQELNEAIKKLLPLYNGAVFQKKGHSRKEMFDAVEKDALKALPVERYEMKEIRMVTVQQNFHVCFSDDKNYYSAPYKYIGKKVKLVLTPSLVEVYHKQERIAVHARSYRQFHYVTEKDHMPSHHRYKSNWTAERFIAWAGQTGEATKTYIEQLLQSKSHPEQGYKACMGIMSFEKKVGKERLENACKRANSYSAFGGYHTIKNILEKGLDKQDAQTQISFNIPPHENLRGGNYYN